VRPCFDLQRPRAARAHAPAGSRAAGAGPRRRREPFRPSAADA